MAPGTGPTGPHWENGNKVGIIKIADPNLPIFRGLRKIEFHGGAEPATAGARRRRKGQ